MRKTLLLALMAAAAASVPAIASAQDHGGWRARDGSDSGKSAGSGQSDHGNKRADRGGGAPASAPAPRANWNGNRGGGGYTPQAAPALTPQADARARGGWSGGNANGGYRGGNGRGYTPQAAPALTPQADARARDGWNGGNANGGYRGYRGGNPNGGYVPQARAPQYNAAPQGWQNNGSRGSSGYRGNNNWRGNNANRDGGWNRGWRGNNQYNWQSYRASNRGAYRLPRYYAPYGWNYGYRRFSIGFVLDSALFGPNYWIDDPYNYRLPAVYGEYRWVRYYNDALLVDVYSGEVVDVVYDIFW